MVNQGQRWIEAEIQFLSNNFHQGLNYCSLKLGRPIAGIRKQAAKLGLISSKSPNRPDYSLSYRPGLRKEWRERAKATLC